MGARAAALTAGNRVPAAAHGGEVAGLYQNGDSGLAFERNLVRERESDTLNRSRGLAQGHGTAEAWCGGEAARSYCGDRLRVKRGRKKGKQERAEVSYPRVKLRWWSRGLEKQQSAGFAVARRLRFCRAMKREERLRGRFPGRRARVESCATALQRDQAGQGGGNTPAAWNHGAAALT